MKKQWFKRSITWIITFALMLQIIPLAVLAEDKTDAGTTDSSKIATVKETATEAYIVEEDVSKRKELSIE